MQNKRFRFDGDALLSSALLSLVLLGYVAAIYAGVVAFGIAPSEFPETDYSPSWQLNLIAIVLIALTLLPVRRWLQSRINTLVYGQHDDSYALISQLNRQLQTMASPPMTLPAVAEAIARALKLPYVAIKTHIGKTPQEVEFGSRSPRAELVMLPVTYLDKPLGELRAASRRPNESLSDSDMHLLHEASRQMGIALHTAQLTSDLQASRERLVVAREEERRRIRNDLHDGLAPTLSSLQLQLGALRNLISENPAEAEAIVDSLRCDLRQATAEIRQLVYDLRPPMLDELGLVGAIKSLRFQDSSVQFSVDAAEALPRLPAAVEVAAYRVASEAIHNVLKHAQATRCEVHIAISESRLELSVVDNGKGLPAGSNSGVGLRSMQERAAELGGTFQVQPGAGGGTRVVAQFPIGD